MKHLPLLTVSLLASLIATSAVADVTTYKRAATGDLTQHGGARRLSSDQTEALKASLSNQTAKNVILLIGDGMGDSEITAARNLAVIKKRINPLTSLTLPRPPPRGLQAPNPITGRLASTSMARIKSRCLSWLKRPAKQRVMSLLPNCRMLRQRH